MARPVQPLGTFGVITVRRTSRGYVALTRFREHTGAYRRVSATGESRAAAENRLKEKIAAGLPSTAEGDLNRQTKIRAVAEVWIREIEHRQDHAPQTIEVYRDIINRIILPGIGDLRLGELTLGTLDRFLKTEAAGGLSRGRHAQPGIPGPPPDGQLAQIFEVMLGTSARLGEALAIRRGDVDLDADQPTVTITGTIVFVRGKGHVRQPHPKHSKYWRTITVPSFTRDALRERLATAGDLALEQTVIHTKQGTPLSPANVRRLWRSIRDASAGLLPDGIDLAQVVPHTLRKTVATALDEAAGTDLAAELLGHSSTAVTRAHYVQPRKRVDPKTAEILEGLRPRAPEHDHPPSPEL